MNTIERMARESAKGDRATVRRVTRKRLVDALNYVNFRRDSIIINLEHIRYGNVLSLRALPQPCAGDVLNCSWGEACPANLAMSYVFRNLMVDRGLDLLVVNGEARSLTNEAVTVVLPTFCHALQPRKARRYSCIGVQATLMQDGASFVGTLEDFTALSFRVIVSAQPPQTFEWIDQDVPVYIVLSDGRDTLYSGECSIVRQTDAKRDRAFVLEPLRDKAKPRRDRLNSKGHSLAPPPNIVFNHPLTGKKIRLGVEEISPCWFSVVEYYDATVLFPGLVVPLIEIETVPGFSVRCRGQVIQGSVQENDGERTIKWRIMLVDMDVEDQGKLFSWLQRLAHHKSHSYGSIDLDDLITFFFDTGFVYPEKYAALQSNKEEFKETYRRLYVENPAIARHFIQMDKGMIQGHLSMIRFYEDTWMIHHHAGMGQHRAGLAVLGEAREYINDCRYLYSSHMDFLLCYFRPNNRFPNRVFGGFARSLDNPKHCSVDAFACFSLSTDDAFQEECDPSWSLHESNSEDVAELNGFYESSSGGVAMKALDLEPDMIGTGNLSEQYKKLGFKRERYLLSLKKDGRLKAVFMAVVSDVGLNMSNLTNCVHVFITDQEDMTAEDLRRHVAFLAPHYGNEEVPVLLYPVSYADSQSIPYEKTYLLWAFDCKYTDRYYEYMGKIITGRKDEGMDEADSIVHEVQKAASIGPGIK